MLSKLIKSKQRVDDHGEVFTPSWLVNEMLDLVKAETERIDSRFLEPACGSGNFLVPVLSRKLEAVDKRYLGSEFERVQHALLAIMSVYGIELLRDNAEECRENLLGLFCSHLDLKRDDEASLAAKGILRVNVVQGDALSLKDHTGSPIVFPEWSYLGKGLFKRRDFKYDELLQLSSFGEGTLFESLEADEIFAPIQEYPMMRVRELSQFVSSEG